MKHIYIHIKSCKKYYTLLGQDSIQIEFDGVWYDAIIYYNEAGERFAKTLQNFNDSFWLLKK